MRLSPVRSDSAVSIATAAILLTLIAVIWFAGHQFVSRSPIQLKLLMFALTVLFAFPILGLTFHFLCYAFSKPQMIQRLERIKSLPEINQGASSSLTVEVFDTFIILIVIILISGLVYWGTHGFTNVQHTLSVCAGVTSLFTISYWENRNESIVRSFSKSITVTLIVGCFAFGLLFSFITLQGPVGIAEVLAWLIPIAWLYYRFRDFMESLFSERNDPGYWATSYVILWRASDGILEKVGRDSKTTQALAVVSSLLIFLLPSEMGLLIPPEVKDMFQTVWSELGEIEVTNQHIGYIALVAFVFFSCSDFTELAPDLLPDHWVFVGPFYNAVLKSALGLALVIFLSPMLIAIFFVGYSLIGSDLALVVGFFTFPQWSQRLFAILIAAQILSYDDPNQSEVVGEQLYLEID